MKWLIASDIHGSAHYCEKLLEAYRAERAHRMLLLGDILYHGPRNNLPEEYNPKAVISMLNAISDDILCVRGNCDTEVDQMVLNFPIMADYAILCADDTMIFATHGHNFNSDRLPPMHRGDILLHGHTHIPKWEENPEYRYFNPGSVSIPKENSAHSYMTFDGKTFQWKSLDGNVYREVSI